MSSYNFQIIGKNQTILYAACRTPYVSLYILNSLTKTFGCSPDVQTSDGFYPLGALIASLHDNIKLGVFDRALVAKYIDAIRILIKFYPIDSLLNTNLTKLKRNKNTNELTAYDDFAQLFLYNFIRDCVQLTEICKLLLVNSHDLWWKSATVLFQVCSAEKIYPGLISRLIECGGDVNEKSIVLMYDIDKPSGTTDPEKSGYPINALIQSYHRIIKKGDDVRDCKDAISIVFSASNMTKIDSEYPGTSEKADEILKAQQILVP